MSGSEAIAWSIAAIGAVAAGGAWLAIVRIRRSARSMGRETRRSARVRAFLQGHETPRIARYTPSDAARASDEQLVVQYLRLVRETCAVQSATLWRLGAGGELRRHTTTGQPVVEMIPARLDALLRWAATERGVVHFDAETPPRFGAIAVSQERANDGGVVLALESDSGMSMERSALRAMVARHAEHIGALLSLLDARHEVHRQHASASVLLRAAQEFQGNRSIDRLTTAICSAALDLSTAQRAALVRWRAATHSGEIEGVSAGHWALVGLPVEDGSLVAQACTDAMPLLWRDASELSSDAPLFSPSEHRARAGTLAIVPLERDLGVVGALVVEGDEAGDVSPDDLRGLRLLAAIAAVSLEAQWEFDEVAQRARTDQLTGLPNRRFFDEQLARMLAEADRFEHEVSLVLLDIDHFKKVNDEHGHDAGDAVLQAIAVVLRERVRGVDVCARFGGEELAVLLPNTGGDGAAELAERLRVAVAECRVRASGKEIRVTASFGIATYPSPVGLKADLFAAADRALYTAKGGGRDRVAVAQ